MCLRPTMSGKQDSKVFVGGLSWETNNDKLRAYFENFGVVREAFISVNRTNGRPRGFGFVTFESPEVAKKVIATKHTIDRREVRRDTDEKLADWGREVDLHFLHLSCARLTFVQRPRSRPLTQDLPLNKPQVEAKESFAKEEQSSSSQTCSDGISSKSKKLFVGGLAPAVDDDVLREHFETYGPVESAEVMLDHDSKRPRGFGFVTFVNEESAEKVFEQGTMQTIQDKQVEIKLAMPRDQMPCQVPMAMGRGGFDANRAMQQQQQHHHQQRNGRFFPEQMPYGQYPGGPGPAGYGPRPQPGAPHGMPPRGPGYRGPPIGPGGFNQAPHQGPGFGNYGNGEVEANFSNLQGLDMGLAALYITAAAAAGGLTPGQLPDFQGQVPASNIPMNPMQINAAMQQQLETSLASLNVQPSETSSANNRTSGTNISPEPGLDASPGLDFYKPGATMGPGWSS